MSGKRIETTGVEVSASVLYMSMSLDGYIAGPDDEPGNPGGDGFMRLHEWYGDFSRPSGPAGELHDELEANGAVLAGRRTVEQVDHWGGDNGGPPLLLAPHPAPGPPGADHPPGADRAAGAPPAVRTAQAGPRSPDRVRRRGG